MEILKRSMVLARAVISLMALMLCAATARAETMSFVMDPFPPFTYLHNGVPAGPMAETLLAACAMLKLECQMEIYPWRRALRMAEEGKVDGIYALANVAEREQAFYMMPPIVESTYGIFAHQSSSLKYTQPLDLDGYTVGVYGPSAASLALEKVAAAGARIEMVVEIDNLTVLRKLGGQRYGDRGAGLANVHVGNHLIRSEGITGLAVAGRVGRIEYCVGLSRKSVSEKRAMEFAAAFRHLIASGKVKEISRKYGISFPHG